MTVQDGDVVADGHFGTAGWRELVQALDCLSEGVSLSTAVRDAAGVAVDMRLEYLNAAARAGQPPGQLAVGGLCSQLWPQMVDNGSFAACMRVLNTGVAESGRFRWTEPDTYQPGGYTYHASRLGADMLLWELRDASLDLSRAETLAAVTADLAEADRPGQVLDTLITSGVVAVGAASGGVAIPDTAGRRYTVVAGHNAGEAVATGFSFDEDAPFPMAHTMRTGQPLFFADAGQRAQAFPAAERLLTGRYSSTAIVPLRVNEHTVGAVSFHFTEPHDFDAAERAFLTALVGQCSQAWERTRHHQASQRAFTQLTALAGLSDQLVAAPDEAAVFEALLAAVVPDIADGALIHLTADPHPLLVASRHIDAAELAALRSLLADYPPPLDAPAGIGHVIRTGEPEVVTDTRPVLDRVARGPEHRAALAQRRSTSWLVTPMHHGGDRIGALTLMRGGDQSFTDRDVPFAAELGRRAAAALDHVRSYARQRQVAHVLQQGLLPRRLPDISGLELAGCYHAGVLGLEAGGDFYDVFTAADGLLGISIGDMCGTGAVAASRTALVRHSTRAFGRLLADPGAVTVAVNTALLEEDLDGAFCSLAYAAVRLDTRPVTLQLALAGHPYPVVRRADGSVETHGVAGTVLGVVPTPRLTVSEHQLHPGDTLVLHTDGATERRNGDHFLGEAGLHQLIADAPTPTAAALVDHLQDKILRHSDQPLHDDLAILAIRINTARSRPPDTAADHGSYRPCVTPAVGSASLAIRARSAPSTR